MVSTPKLVTPRYGSVVVGKRETVFNWGAYDSSQDHFLFRFFMGDAEYKLAMMSRQYNLKRVR